jgi:DNA-binding MarR family transcriptional regulator
MARECLAVRARVISRRLSRLYDSALKPLEITISQLNVLSVIDNLPLAPSGRVAALLSMEISTLSRNARIMQKQGWITIEQAERGNGRILALTPSGREMLHDALPAWEQAQSEAQELLGAQRAEDLWQLGNSLWDAEAGASIAPPC